MSLEQFLNNSRKVIIKFMQADRKTLITEIKNRLKSANLKLNQKTEVLRKQAIDYLTARRDNGIARRMNALAPINKDAPAPINNDASITLFVNNLLQQINPMPMEQQANITGQVNYDVIPAGYDTTDILQVITALDQDFPLGMIKKSPYGDNTYKLNIDAISEAYIQRYIGYIPNSSFVIYSLDKFNKMQSVFPNGNPLYTPKAMNDFIHGVLMQFYSPTHLYAQIYPRTAVAQPLTLFESPDINCVIKAYISRFPKDRVKALKFHADHLVLGTDAIPVTKEVLMNMQKILRKRFIIKSQTGTWFDTDPTGKRGGVSIVLFGSDNHASVYIPIAKTITSVNYVPEQEIIKSIREIHQPTKLFLELSLQTDNDEPISTIKSYIHGSTITKSYRPPAPFDTDSLYYRCQDELSFEYKRFVNQNNLRPLRGEYFEIFKSADHHLTTQQFIPTIDTKTEYHNYDMVKAFPSYKLNPLYEQFKLITGYVRLFSNNDQEYLSAPGASYITNIVYNDPIVEATKWIQSDNWYNHIRLYFIIINDLATFDVVYTVTAGSEDLELPLKPFDTPLEVQEKLNVDISSALYISASYKQFNNPFIGRLISGGQANTMSEYYQANNNMELEQIRYDLQQDKEIIGASLFMDGVLVAERKLESKTQLYHMHSCIIDYQQTTFMSAMCQVRLDNLVAFNTDGFFTKRPVNIELTNSPHGFSYKKQKINFSSTLSPAIHQGYQLSMIPPPIEIYASRLSPNTLTNGPPGCGKSYNRIIKNPHTNSVILTPTNILKYNHKQDLSIINPTLPVLTAHSFFNINNNGNAPQQIYENVAIDEITMIPKHILTKVKQICKKHRINLDLIGDIDKNGIYQLEPPALIIGEDINGRKIRQEPIAFSDLEDFEIFTEISPIRRQKLKEDYEFLDSLRGMDYETMSAVILAHFTTLYPNNIIQNDCANFDSTSTGISGTHRNISTFNELLVNRAKDKFEAELLVVNPGRTETSVSGNVFPDPVKDAKLSVPARCIKATATSVKGMISEQPIDTVWFGRKKADEDTPAKYKYEAAYFNTADAIQGATIKNKIFIDMKGSSRKNLLYTAISRCEYLRECYLIL